MNTQLIDQARAVDAMNAVTIYFLERDGPHAYLPRAEWIVYWLTQRKTPAEIYAIAMGKEHES